MGPSPCKRGVMRSHSGIRYPCFQNGVGHTLRVLNASIAAWFVEHLFFLTDTFSIHSYNALLTSLCTCISLNFMGPLSNVSMQTTQRTFSFWRRSILSFKAALDSFSAVIFWEKIDTSMWDDNSYRLYWKKAKEIYVKAKKITKISV